MSIYERDRMPIEEENKHARRGCLLALVIVPIICFILLWPVLTLTGPGQLVMGHTVLLTLSRGVPLPVPYVRGLANTATASCTLDHTNPKPADFDERQESLSTEYESMVASYNRYYNIVRRNKGTLSWYDPPEEVPGNFASAKLFYCHN
ncbi:MAG: hypothetical protein KDJ52_05740 [Anaerolineae bacterium]|nr:hypothetical protein [Anaerolineae bacterium]